MGSWLSRSPAVSTHVQRTPSDLDRLADHVARVPGTGVTIASFGAARSIERDSFPVRGWPASPPDALSQQRAWRADA